jgi:hypothetical protein
LANKRPDPYLLLALLLSVFAIGPLLEPGYFWGAHDARHNVYFLFEFDRAIQDGIWYPRWAPDFAYGYGYPFFNIYGPLSTYIGEFFHLLGFGFVDSVKLVFGLSVFASAAAMYGFARRLMGPRGGLVAAVAYVYVPYHIFDLYVRAALAESVGFVFVPLALWAFQEAVERPRLAAVLAAGLAYGGLMFTSNLIAFLFSPILALYLGILILARVGADQPLRHISWQSLHLLAANLVNKGAGAAAGLALGLGLSAIFWLPGILEYRFVRVDQWAGGRYDFHPYFVYFFQLFSPHWGFGPSIPGPDDDLGFQLGAVPTILALLSLLVTCKTEDARLRRTLLFFQVFTPAIVFLMLPVSTPLWDNVGLVRLAQFPWRLLALSAVSLAFLCGSLVATTPPTRSLPHSFLPTVALVSLLILSSYPYLTAQVRDPAPTEGPVSLAALMRFQHSSDEMTGSTAWVRRIPRWSNLADDALAGLPIKTKVNYGAIPPGDVLAVHSVEMDSVHELLWVHAADDAQSVTFYTPYYPGWNAYVFEDLGQQAGDLRQRVGQLLARPAIKTTDPEGWMVVPIPRGDHFLLLRFEDTPVRVVGKVVTLLSAGVALVIGLLNVYSFSSRSTSSISTGRLGRVKES